LIIIPARRVAISNVGLINVRSHPKAIIERTCREFRVVPEGDIGVSEPRKGF